MKHKLTHVDMRFGDVALDMRVMTADGVKACRDEVVKRRQAGKPASFGQVAQELGYIPKEIWDKVETEECRRRLLIQGYEIIDIIGSGLIAAVYRAVQLAMDREVALKILHPRLAKDPEFVRGYIAEARAVSRFHHPNIVQGIDVGESNGFYYFAHEYLAGGCLGDKVKKEGPLSERQAQFYLRQTVSALSHAANANVLHGDINPGNLLLDRSGNLKLANLGVPRLAKTQEKNPEAKDRNAGYDFVRCGPNYIAPEQVANISIADAQTDLYSLGATFFHLLTGFPPFTGDTPEEIMRARLNGPPPSLATRRPDLSQELTDTIGRLMAVDPKDRPAGPGDLERQLNDFFMQKPSDWSALTFQTQQPTKQEEPPREKTSRRQDPRRRAAILHSRPKACPARITRNHFLFKDMWRWVVNVLIASAAALATILLLMGW